MEKLLILLSVISLVYGRPETRIIGGTDAPAGQFPFAAAIHIHTPTSTYFCGGAMVHNVWILTSAHCVEGATSFTIQLGSNLLNRDDPNRVVLSTSEYFVHPDFDPEKIENDVAMIKLRMTVYYSEFIQPISLPPVSLLNDTQVTAIGWGQTSDTDPALAEHLQYVNAQILSNAECKAIYGNQIADTMACVEGNYNEGTCIGDNGGPLVEYSSRVKWVVGIASFISFNGCESTDPSGYTRIFPYLSWIRATIRGS